MKKTGWVGLSLLLVLSLLLASCASLTGSTRNQDAVQPPNTQVQVVDRESTAESASGSAVTVTIYTGYGTGIGPDRIQLYDQIAVEYNRTHTAIQIAFIHAPYEERGNRFNTMLAGGSAPDIVMPIGGAGLAEQFNDWADLSPYMTRGDFDLGHFTGKTAQIHQTQLNGTIALPLCAYPSVLFYNKDLFDAAGAAYPPQAFSVSYADGSPWDLEKMVAVARTLSLDSSGNDATSPNFDPAAMRQWGWDGWDWVENMAFAAKFGEAPGTGVSADLRRSSLATQQYQDALNFHKDSLFTWYIRPTMEETFAFYESASDPIGSGLVAMWEIHSWIAYTWDSWQQTMRIGTAAPPAVNGRQLVLVQAESLAIPQAAQNKEAAWEVIQWFYQPENLQRLVSSSGCIPVDAGLASAWAQDMAARYPEMNPQVLVDALQYIETLNHETWKPDAGRINTILSQAYDQVDTGANLDVEGILNQADQEVQALLDDFWQGQ